MIYNNPQTMQRAVQMMGAHSPWCESNRAHTYPDPCGDFLSQPIPDARNFIFREMLRGRGREEVARRNHRTKSEGGHGERATRNYEEMERLTKWGELREIKKHGY